MTNGHKFTKSHLYDLKSLPGRHVRFSCNRASMPLSSEHSRFDAIVTRALTKMVDSIRQSGFAEESPAFPRRYRIRAL